MPDIESAAKFTLKVSVGDPTKPVDLNTILEQIGNVKVYENLPEIPINTEPTLLFVVPEGDFDAKYLPPLNVGPKNGSNPVVTLSRWKFTSRTDTSRFWRSRRDEGIQPD